MEQTERLKEILKDLMYSGKIRSQRDFGEKLGYKPAFTSQILSGHKSPKDLPNKLYQVFGVRLEPDIKKPDPQKEPDDVQAKYLALLERQESRAIDIGESAARAAVDRMAERFASKEDVKTLAASLTELTAEVRRNMSQNLTFQGAAAILYSEVGNLLPKDARNRIDTLMLEIATGQNMDMIPAGGMQGTAKR